MKKPEEIIRAVVKGAASAFKETFFLLNAFSRFVLLFVLLISPVAYADARTLEDLRRFPQSAAAYLPAEADKPLASFENQRIYADEYRARHFAPWQNPDISYLDITWDTLRKLQSGFLNNTFYGKDGKPIPSSQLASIAANASLGLNLSAEPAVMLKDADVRVLPSSMPVYRSRESALGERGFLRADVFQNSTAKPGEPVAVFSASSDGKWALISTGAVIGWVVRDSVVSVDPEFMDKYMELPLAVFIKDNVRLRDGQGELIATAKMGAVIPCDGDDLLLPARGSDGRAVIQKYRPGKGVTAPFPVSFTPSNAVRAAEQLLGERYSWGGSYGLRDCSALTKDYFALFGIWLPRNSGDQAKAGASIPISGMSAARKIQTIVSRGVPFATLLHMKGHIMLYLGIYDGEPVVLHSVWGVHTEAKGGKSARVVVGKTSVTGLSLGKELKNKKKSTFLIDNVSSLVFPMANMW